MKASTFSLLPSSYSKFELETQLEIAKNLGFIEPREYESIYLKCLELEKMISSLINKLGRVK
ncbi:four helix bundle protein [Dissulfuribacter thermophilus]|uniref:four helix bundle protein n=1 Tax=Dissulfuribacter thermophilus TaxID=1156395 RepID=UPI00082DFA3F